MATTETENGNVDRKEHWNSPEAQQRSLSNLKPFTSERRPQNPGRKRLDEVERLFRSAGRKKVAGDPQKRNFLQLTVHRLYMDACKGSTEAAKVILERLFGKVVNGEEMEQLLGSSQIIVPVVLNYSRFGYEPEEVIEKLKLDEKSKS